MTQLAIIAVDNKNLFSNYYLDNQIKNNPEWTKDEHKAAFSEITKLYDAEKDFLPSLNEKQLEQRFFAPIFKILNHTVEVNESTETQEFPDYAFFPDRNSHLAERMIEMNKEKNAEIKSFLSFLEGEIGAHLADLSNKTAIQEYYKYEFSGADKDKVYFIDVLVKNKKKLNAGYDPMSPDNYKRLQEWYEKSVGRLAPLLRRIEATDGLIDAIVYKLYGLSEEEIKIVEESISVGKDAKEPKADG